MSVAAAGEGGREPLTDRGRRTRDGLLAAARTVFEERGFTAARMGDIAEAAGVSHGTVYTWFDTKEDLLADVVGGIVAELYDALRVRDDADPVRRIDLANRSYLDAYRANARLLEIVEQVATTDPRFRGILADLRATHVERVAATVRRMQRDGVASRDLDPRLAAAALCSMVEGFARNWFGRGERFDEDAESGTLTRLWARALQLPEPGPEPRPARPIRQSRPGRTRTTAPEGPR